ADLSGKEFAQLIKCLPAIKIIRINDRKGFMNGLFGAKNGMAGAKRLFSFLVLKSRGHVAVQGLDHKVDLDLSLKLWNEHFPDHVQDFIPDDKHHLAKSRPDGVKNGVFHDGFLPGAKSFYLFVSSVAASYSRRQNQKCRFVHGIFSTTYLVTVQI